MTGFFWHILIFSVLGVFLVLMARRILAIARLPVHLRWELAPIPHEKGKNKYGGSYLEEYEWWHKKRRKSCLPPIVYMAGEIFLLKGIWKNNPGLWPFSFALHIGIYLVIISIVIHVINALFIITSTSAAVLDVFKNVAAIAAIIGYILGVLGAIGLILKRSIDINFRTFSSFSTYFRLVFLAAIFVSGIIAWFSSSNFTNDVSLFTRDLFILDSGITATAPLASHIVIVSLFLVYLPLTDMIHFITKYFTYHAVRWNDEPKDEKMTAELNKLLDQPVSWSAVHVKANGRKNWIKLTAEKTEDDKKA